MNWTNLSIHGCDGSWSLLGWCESHKAKTSRPPRLTVHDNSSWRDWSISGQQKVEPMTFTGKWYSHEECEGHDTFDNLSIVGKWLSETLIISAIRKPWNNIIHVSGFYTSIKQKGLTNIQYINYSQATTSNKELRWWHASDCLINWRAWTRGLLEQTTKLISQGHCFKLQ